VNSKPLVTILICKYNYGRFLAEAIESALAQTWKNIEVIVVDDGSTDESREILTKYKGKIRIILKENGGQASAFNAGIAKARGEIVCFLDSDDICHRDRVSRVIEKYKQGKWGLVCHDLDVIDGNGTSVKMKWTQFAGTNLIEISKTDIIIKHNYAWIFSPTSGMSLPTKLAHKIFPLPAEKWKISADEPLAYASACLDSVGVIPEILGSYRLHGNNLFADFHKDTNARTIAAITHTTRRFYFCKQYASEMHQELTDLKTNYYFYRRCCLIAREKPYRYILPLVKKNIQHHKLQESLLMAFLKIPAFFAADVMIILKRLLLKSSRHNLLKTKFDEAAQSMNKDQLGYILHDK